MASMNNWLAFSLSPQELPTSQPHQTHSPSTAVSRLISGEDVSTDCFGLSADTASDHPLGIPNLRPDASYGILEAFNRTHHQSQDWNMKSMDFKGNSELSMLVGSSSNQNSMGNDEPKLEDFLGGNSFSDHDQKLPHGMPGAYDTSSDYMYSNSSLQVPETTMVTSNGQEVVNNVGAAANNSIGLSMIKTWLRNQPAPPQQAAENKNSDVVGTSSGTNCGGALVGNVSSLTNTQSLSLSMSTGSQSSSPLPLLAAAAASGGGESSSTENKQKGGAGGLDGQSGAIEAVPRKSIDTFGQRTSIYRGVTRHRWTGRYEAHLWDNSCRREGQTRKGRQVYLGGYDKEDKAARAYDLAALKYWGTTTTTNFPISNYEKELEEMKHMTRQEYVASLRRKSSGFSRGASIYRGVTRHHQHGRWQARIGRVAGNKDLYLGTFSTQEEAAEAYDIAAIKFRGLNAVTNFDMSRYDVKSILESPTLPIGGAAKRLKEASESTEASVNGRRTDIDDHMTSQLTDSLSSYSSHHQHHHHHHGWPTIAFQQQPPPPLGMHYPYALPRGWCKQERDAVVAAAHSLQDLHQLHLGSNTHNFFQPSAVLHNLMSMESPSSLEHSTGSNSVIYNGSMGGTGGAGTYQGVVGGNGGYVMPVSALVADHSNTTNNSASFGDDEGKPIGGYDNMLGNAYYLSHPPAAAVMKGNGYEQTGASNTWLPSSAAQAMAAQRANGMAVCHGASLFSVWNDAN